MQIQKLLLDSDNNRPALRGTGNYSISKVEGLVIHWTGNIDKGADAIANRNYFNTTDRSASAHYIVDDKQVIQCIPDNEVAWHVGDKVRLPLDKLRREEIKNARGPNYALLGIEMCVNVDGNWSETVYNTLELIRLLMERHNLTIGQLYRHYDITGKPCPIMFIPSKVNGRLFDWSWLTFLSLIKEDSPEVKIVEKEVIVYKDRKVNYTLSELLKLITIKLWPWAR